VRAFRQHLLDVRPAEDVERMRSLASSARYQAGAIQVEAEYYRIHYRAALRRPEHVELIVGRLRKHVTEASVLTARAIEERLYDQTWNTDGYDLIPKLAALEIPTLVLHGEDDFVPVALAARIAEAMPRGRLVVLEDCGHFAYLERPEAFYDHVAALFAA
jgi:proline iminopeptidase